MEEFLQHVKEGLSKNPKKLSSRYFYDEKGDALFQKIMELEEYYLPKKEMEIIHSQSENMAEYISQQSNQLEIVELGAGDGRKTRHLLGHFFPFFESLDYTALDISKNVLKINEKHIRNHSPELNYKSVAGDYFETYNELQKSQKRRLVLFPGANIGNYPQKEAVDFFNFVRANLSSDEFFLVAFDLVKHPRKIIKAYDDSAGVTKAFNLNLLERINRELGGDFNVSKFDHYPFYNPQNGITSSHIISLEKQVVTLCDGSSFHFDQYEAIHTEVSKKFFIQDIVDIAKESHFEIDQKYYDGQEEYVFVLFKNK